MISYFAIPGLVDLPPLREPTMEDVVEVVCDHWQIADINRKTRKQEYVRARQMICYLTKELIPRKSLESIGERFCQDHTTVIHSIKTTGDLMDTEPEYKNTLNQLRAQIVTRNP